MTVWSTIISIVAGIGIGLVMMYYKNTDYSNVFVLNLKDFTANMRKGQLIDVRKKIIDENNKIKGSRHFTPSKVKSKSVNLRKDLSVYVYCDNGKLSKRVAKKLSRNGFNNIYVLSNGYLNYKENH
ncbi:MAG: Thiosulfate sulfurtransferase GlpE [Candidatus Izimaplasma bacterium HR2]|nr:MAG: Thiosulfate sulfurtransferase GlpE [Candidatus Izimaplasma bacterium HR2]